jgi:F-type H+-transporting ATPase subunit gamma
MANLKEIRTRISSVTSTRQITSAMKMVSAARLRKAQDAIVRLRPYASKLQEILSSISDALRDDEDNVFANPRETEKVLLVVISSNRGLCGAFNTSVIKEGLNTALNGYQKQFAKGNVSFFNIGRHGDDFFKKKGYQVAGSRNDLFDDLTYSNVSEVSSSIMKEYVDGKYDRVELIYNQFKNAAVQVLTREQFLPIKVEEKQETTIESTFTDYIFEPSKDYIIKELIPKSLRLQFYKALLDSYASEHGARMTSMHKATDNATEIIKDLRLEYNKARQAIITNEILEIISGANALDG